MFIALSYIFCLVPSHFNAAIYILHESSYPADMLLFHNSEMINSIGLGSTGNFVVLQRQLFEIKLTQKLLDIYDHVAPLFYLLYLYNMMYLSLPS